MANEHGLLGQYHAVVRPDADLSDNKHATAGPLHASGIRAPIRWVARVFRLWRRRVAESAELTTMSDQELRDIGVNRYEVDRELRKGWRY